jgi:hypothetical protein
MGKKKTLSSVNQDAAPLRGVHRWIKTRDLPAHTIGRHCKFKLSEADDRGRAGAAESDESPAWMSKTTKKGRS